MIFFLIQQVWCMQLYFRASLVCNFTDLVNGGAPHLSLNYISGHAMNFL